MRKKIAAWLLACCALTLLILVTGGATRLTHSGLSIVEWKPVAGTLPPLTASQWEGEFAKYRTSPEYRQTNFGMSLAEFKSIFWLEYFHRLLGRIAGLAFLMPFLYFAFNGSLEKNILLRLGGIACLWGLQGGLGWYMVRSGLVDVPHVSHYRLTAHLSMAGILYSSMLWTALGLRRPEEEPVWKAASSLRLLSGAVAAMTFLTMMSGGLVAGLRAGLAFNTFPLMNGHWVPPFLFELRPLVRNFFDSIVTVQFDHRVLALLLAAAASCLCFLGSRGGPPRLARRALQVLAVAMAVQLALGILTLLLRVPVFLGVAHQAGAFALLTGALMVLHEARAGTPASLKS